MSSRKTKVTEDGAIRLRLEGTAHRGRALYAIVDAVDWRFAAIRWKALRQPGGSIYAYTTLTLGRGVNRALYLHREIMAVGPGVQVDHRNGDTLDCRRENLRVADHIQNGRNAKLSRRNTSGFKGVSKVGDRWRAYIRVSAEQQLSLGTFDDPEQAAGAYDSAAYGIFGEFARLNAEL